MSPEGLPNSPEADAGVVLLAAGGSARMGGDKMLLELRGRPVLQYSLETFQRSNRVSAIVIVASDANRNAINDLVANADYDKVSAVVAGGARRQDSTANGVDQLMSQHGSGIKFILVHDGARPFVDEAMIERGLMAAAQHGAAVPALPVSDTIKSVKGDGTVEQTLDRSRLRAIQTPQVFQVDVFAPALRPTQEVTDDASFVELVGGSVGLFDGNSGNIKLTTPDDIERAEFILARRNPGESGAMNRWGTGFDGHALVSGGPLRLGGVNIEHHRHLEGHSDGDVLLHAIASAVLGAVGLGDLGSNFPSDDPAFAGIDSRELLERVVSMADNTGWEVSYLDATIIAQQPKLSPYVNRINNSIAEMLSIPVDSINIKVTSTDHVGAIGTGEGMAAQAVATLSSK